MVVIIKNSPDTLEGKSALKIAEDSSADIILLQNGVYFVMNNALEGFKGKAYALKEDLELRGISIKEKIKGLKHIDWSELIDKITGENKVIGAL